jgi:hypothetical protein
VTSPVRGIRLFRSGWAAIEPLVEIDATALYVNGVRRLQSFRLFW